MNNMKPFDLEAAKAGKPVVARTGCQVKTIFFPVGQTSDLRVIHANDVEKPHDKGGAALGDSNYDLFMAPERKTGWMNVYPFGDLSEIQAATSPDVAKLGGLFKEKFMADAVMCQDGLKRIACVEVTYAEGQGIE